MHAPHVLSGGRYPVLRALAIIYVIGAALAAVSTILTMLWVLFAASFAWTDRVVMAFGALAAGFFVILTMLAIAEVLKLVIDIEHNTRMSAPGRMGVPSSMTTAGPETMVAVSDDGGAVIVTSQAQPTAPAGGRLGALDEETAEAALLRGH